MSFHVATPSLAENPWCHVIAALEDLLIVVCAHALEIIVHLAALFADVVGIPCGHGQHPAVGWRVKVEQVVVTCDKNICKTGENQSEWTRNNNDEENLQPSDPPFPRDSGKVVSSPSRAVSAEQRMAWRM